jgi:GntR family transcriptional regulator
LHAIIDTDLQRRLVGALDRVITPGAPKYAGLRDAVLQLIRDGYWRTGDKLPPEQEIVGLTGLSLGTVQRGLRILTREGVLHRTQGRGTFVAAEAGGLRDPWHFRFLDDDETLLPVFTKAVARRVVSAEGPWGRAIPAPVFVSLERLLDVNREFTCSNFFYADRARFGELNAIPLAELDGVNLKHVIEDRCGIKVHRLRHRVGIERAPDAVAAKIGVKHGGLCLSLEVLSFSYLAEPIYYQITYIPPTDRKLAPLDTIVRAA